MSNPLRERRDPRFHRRPGMGQAGMDLGYGTPVAQGVPLIMGRRFDPLASSRGQPSRPRPVYGALSQAYNQTLLSQKQSVAVLGTGRRMVSTDYLNWVPSEAGPFAGNETLSGDPTVLTEPVVAATNPPAAYASAPRQSLADLVTNHLTAARRAYMDNGWRRFRTGDYQGALRMFSLAENASLDSLPHRADAIMAMVYAGIAAGQFAQAANSLEWLVRDTSQFGRQGHPEAFNRIFDDNNASTMVDLHVGPEGLPQTAEYERGNLAVESLAAKNPNLAAARALLAVVEWGRGRRANAIFEAKKITDPGERLSALASVLEEADRLRQWRPSADQRGLAGEPGLASPSTQPVQ